MRRFFIKTPIQDTMEIPGEDAHHIMRVLRLAVGKPLLVVDCSRKVAEAEISGFSGGAVQLKLVHYLEADTEPPIEVTLAQCLPKADKMEFIVQKAVELGVTRICPVVSENCVVRYDAVKREARQKKWQRIADEAAKQCGRTSLPVVEPIADLSEFLSASIAGTEAIMCYEGRSAQGIKTVLEKSVAHCFTILIGPEGGFSPVEVALCEASGIKTVTMGPRILRTETAALAAVSLVMYQNGDLDGRS